jgi:hypothetical protein
MSDGLLFKFFERTKVFHWVINLLAGFLNEKLRTILTDENLVLLFAIDEFRRSHPNIGHRLCVWHKRNNFAKHVQGAVRDRKVLIQALDLFDNIICDQSPRVIDQSIEQLQVLMPNLCQYIQTEIFDILPKLSEDFRGNILILKCRSTQADESANDIQIPI